MLTGIKQYTPSFGCKKTASGGLILCRDAKVIETLLAKGGKSRGLTQEEILGYIEKTAPPNGIPGQRNNHCTKIKRVLKYVGKHACDVVDYLLAKRKPPLKL